jgi:hypothetical protein
MTTPAAQPAAAPPTSPDEAALGAATNTAIAESIESQLRLDDVTETPSVDVDETPADQPPAWPHQRMEFLGDEWEVRAPTNEGLMAFALATSKFIPPEMQANFMGLFLREHTSLASLTQLFERMMTPDSNWDQDSVSKFLQRIAEMAS